MSVSPHPHTPALTRLWNTPKYEVIPMKGVEKQLDSIPAEAHVSVTCSPTKGIPATLSLLDAVLDTVPGVHAVPHIAARLVTGHQELDSVLSGLAQRGVTEIFVVGGDAQEPQGPFAFGIDLLKAISASDHHFRLGTTAYPEGHPTIAKEILEHDLFNKQAYASYMATQMCFDPDVISTWLYDMRDKGVTLPVHLGIPGVIDPVKLMNISSRIGVGDSLRYLKKHAATVMKLMSGYTPNMLSDGLSTTLADKRANIEMFHVYTFNLIKKTEEWRQKQLPPAA